MRTFTNLTFALIIAVLIASCSSASKDKPTQLAELKAEQAKITKQIAALEAELAKDKPAAVSAKSKEVIVTEVTPRKFEHYVQTQGAVESEQNIVISAKTPGIVTHVLVREGEAVVNGQVLAQIDNTLILRGIEELKSQSELVNTVYERQKNLWEQKIGTEVQYLQAKNNKEGLEKRLASLNEQNDMTKIKSLIDGVVDAVDVKVGQNIAPGMPAVRVVNNAELKIAASISEAYASRLKKGDKILVSFPDMNKTFEARLSFVARNIDPLSRTFIVEASLPSSPELRPNMTAVVKVVFASFPSALVVPVNAIQNINGEKVVYVIETTNNQNVARRRIVEVSGVYDNFAQITKGINAGDKIVTTGFQGLNDGESVKI